ncbi:MAG TPA: metalloregulator ArsR/SmtB family transcription factor [Phycisphaerae bacterium]|nr:metalloregulator ArsR/SmtB family transcription factor [Phycisphaerae bacterium]
MDDPKRLSRILKVLSVATRVRIVQLLKGRALCVNALAARLDVTQGAVSQHLRLMRDAGLVIDEKRGYYVHYRLNERTLAAWREAIGELLDPTAGPSANTKGASKCAAAMTRRKAARSRKT